MNQSSELSLCFPWKLDDESIIKELEHISKILLKEYKSGKRKIYPELSKIFRAFELTNLNNVKVVILGQDPYSNGVANGIAFSTDDKHIPHSLNKIFEELRREYPEEEFNPETGDLTSWAKQGVLLMNYSLTVFSDNVINRVSHEYLWGGFTYKLIRYINRNTLNTVFMLWGSKAQSLEPLIDTSIHLVLTAPHPAADAYKRSGGNSFLKCNHFKLANEYLKEKRGVEIDWLMLD
jgi:uracil-DNA glycosylase